MVVKSNIQFIINQMKKTFLLLFGALLFLGTSCTGSKEQIFNGKDLSNWEFVVENNAVDAAEVYWVENGEIYIKGDPFGYMYTKKEYTNYTFEVEYRWDGEATNSGVFLLIEETKNPFPKGIECQLMAGKAGDFVLLGGSDMEEYELPEGVTERPDFPVIEKMTASTEKAVGEWNKVRVTVRDGIVEVYINDVYQNRGTSPAKSGHIGLQSEGGGIYFRNLKLTEL